VSVAAVIAVAIGALLNADPKRIVQGISWMRTAIVPLIALTFVVDCLTPLGIAVPMLYVLPVLLTSLTVGVEWSMAAAVLANVLTYVGYYLSPAGGDIDTEYINRLIASVLIWAAVIIGWLLRNVREDIQTFYADDK
jgi:K+-sensing histidine kinase KdpD